MSGPSDAVGYKNPPSATRWKKGQSANPGGRSSARSKNAVETIDRLLLRPVNVSENGRRRRAPTLEAILIQLWAKEFAGDQRALRTRLKYEELARRNRPPDLEIEFVDSDYTRALVAGHSSEGLGDG